MGEARYRSQLQKLSFSLVLSSSSKPIFVPLRGTGLLSVLKGIVPAWERWLKPSKKWPRNVNVTFHFLYPAYTFENTGVMCKHVAYPVKIIII